MRAISIRQPVAYLAGVLNGDGWLTSVLALRCADRDFARAFSRAISAGFDITTLPKRDERGYWLVRTRNGFGRFNSLRGYEPASRAARCAWLRGLFDSEGNAQCLKKPRGERSFDRRVAMYSTNRTTLKRAARYLAALGIASVMRTTRNSAGHIGTKIVLELRLRSSRENYSAFATLVGSSIRRKGVTLARIVSTYHPDLAAARRAGQAKGAATRTARFNSETLPCLLASVRLLMGRGCSPTFRRCMALPGYAAARHRMVHSEIVRRARCA